MKLIKIASDDTTGLVVSAIFTLDLRALSVLGGLILWG
jgi:hypothetical protein